jgi:hypothetical protein
MNDNKNETSDSGQKSPLNNSSQDQIQEPSVVNAENITSDNSTPPIEPSPMDSPTTPPTVPSEIQPQQTEETLSSSQQPQPSQPENIVQSVQSGQGKGSKNIIFLVLGILVLITGIVVGYFIYQNFQPSEIQIVETTPSFTNLPTTASSPTLSAAVQWLTYEDSVLNVSFQYPEDWTLQESPLKLTSSDSARFITITTFNPTVVGIDYCSANLEDEERCEKTSTQEGVALVIDWGATDNTSAIVLYSTSDQSQGISISLSTNPEIPAGLQLTENDREFFRTFLSNFIFPE